MPLLQMKVNAAKSNFFDRRAVIERLDKVAHRGLKKFGAHTRRAVRSSLRKARQKTLAEMTHEERQRFRIRQEIAKREGRPRPKKPPASSKPGEPPRMHSGEIKQFLFFAYDADQRSVVVGPAALSRPTGAPEILEEGGFVITRNGRARIEPRPYMKPQFDKLHPQLPRFLTGLVP